MINSPGDLTIDTAKFLPLRLDFRMNVAHGLAHHKYSVNIAVEILSETGKSGFGECVPRSYVTGETPESVALALDEMLPTVTGIHLSSPADVVSLLENIGNSKTGSHNPAALCALELALLDLAGKHWNISVTDILGLERNSKLLVYSLVVPLLPMKVLPPFLENAKSFNFPNVKVKIDGHNPAGRVRAVKEILGPDIEIRVDANCSWERYNAHVLLREMADLGVVSIEQPLPADDFEGMAELFSTRALSITLDESILTPEDVKRCASTGTGDIINVRISKCGGLLGALRIIEAAHNSGLDIQLGAHVGESCILSAAGMHLAAGTLPFRWLEGFFGTHLLVKDLCKKDFCFGHGGLVNPLDGPGLSVDIDRHRIDEAHALYISARN